MANITPKFHSGIDAIPAANYVSGNGTASVMVDNYLYFVGGVVKKSDIKYGDNEYYANGKVSDAGIYRVKIGDNGVPVLDYEYDNTYTDEEKKLVEDDISQKKVLRNKKIHYDLRAFDDLQVDSTGKNVNVYDMALTQGIPLIIKSCITD